MKSNFDKFFENEYKNDSNYDSLMELMNSEENKIGDKFLTTRIPKDLTQKEVADYLNISLETYIKIESGASQLDISILEKYLKRIESYDMIPNKN